MSTNSQINAGLMTAFGVVVAGLVPAFTVNFWYGMVDLLAMVVIAIVYELLP